MLCVNNFEKRYGTLRIEGLRFTKPMERLKVCFVNKKKRRVKAKMKVGMRMWFG